MEHKILIAASAEQIWPWLLQLGTGRAGWYSYDWIDNFAKNSFQYIEPDLQSLNLEDTVNGFKLVEKIENQKLVFQISSWLNFTYYLKERARGTELQATLQVKGPRLLLMPTLGLAHDIMQRKQLKEIQKRVERPFSAACERNKKAILLKLKEVLGTKFQRVFEVGAGTGQHALYFTNHMCNLHWTPADIASNLEGIDSWVKHAPQSQVAKPYLFDLNSPKIPDIKFDAIYSANVLHIVEKNKTEFLIDLLPKILNESGIVLFYGPFNYNGSYTSDTNQKFDQWLKSRDPESGIRDFEWLSEKMQARGFYLENDFAMPANNRFLVFQRNA
tara:strand:- start:702 stop:1691 length:990 start_codon:yes stop_codon:yes gene_type:complete